MKIIVLILAVASLALPQSAQAGHGRGGGGHGEGRAERQFRDHDRGPRAGRRFDGGRRFAAPFGPREVAYRGKRDKGPKHARPMPPRRAPGLGRGQTLPPQLRGPRVEDYGRYRLRRPPPGYSYHRRGNRVYLLSDDTGMIFEVVPLGR